MVKILSHRRMQLYAGATEGTFALSTDYEHTKAKSLILCSPNSNLNPKNIFFVEKMVE